MVLLWLWLVLSSLFFVGVVVDVIIMLLCLLPLMLFVLLSLLSLLLLMLTATGAADVMVVFVCFAMSACVWLPSCLLFMFSSLWSSRLKFPLC